MVPLLLGSGYAWIRDGVFKARYIMLHYFGNDRKRVNLGSMEWIASFRKGDTND